MARRGRHNGGLFGGKGIPLTIDIKYIKYLRPTLAENVSATAGAAVKGRTLGTLGTLICKVPMKTDRTYVSLQSAFLAFLAFPTHPAWPLSLTGEAEICREQL